jgi:hypothetical protein
MNSGLVAEACSRRQAAGGEALRLQPQLQTKTPEQGLAKVHQGRECTTEALAMAAGRQPTRSAPGTVGRAID